MLRPAESQTLDSPHSRRSRRGPSLSGLPGLLVNIALSLAVTAALLAGAEAVARKLEPPARAHPLADTRGLDWVAEWQGDFFVMKSTSVGWPSWQDFNGDGLRDRAHTVARPAGTYRLVCLGDSVTLGYGFARDQAFPQQVQSLADARGPGLEVFNVAIIGWSTRQERYAYERIARRYRPDAVVLAIVLNDMEDLENNLSRPPAFLTALFHRSALVRRLVNAEGREIASIEEMFEQPEPARVTRGYALMFDEIRRLRDEIRADEGRLILMVMPELDQVGPHPHPPVPEERIGAFARAEGLTVIDPLPSLRQVGPAAYMDRVHLTPAGSARVAEAVLSSEAVPAAAYATRPLRDALAAAGAPADPGGAPVATLAALLGSGSPAVRREAAWALRRRGPEAAAAAAPLEAALADPDPSVRAESARALGTVGPAAAPATGALFARLDDAQPEVRWAAADALGTLGADAPRNLGALTRALGNGDPYVRGFAVWALNEAGPAAAAAVPALEARLQDPEPGVRTLAIRALGNLEASDAAAVAGLADAVARGTGDDRWRAARALGKLGPAAAGATRALAGALSDPDEKLRYECALALRHVGPPAEAAVPALVAAEHDRSPAVREAAQAAIVRITSNAR